MFTVLKFCLKKKQSEQDMMKIFYSDWIMFFDWTVTFDYKIVGHIIREIKKLNW